MQRNSTLSTQANLNVNKAYTVDLGGYMLSGTDTLGLAPNPLAIRLSLLPFFIY